MDKEFEALQKAILDMVNLKLVVDDTELHKEFVNTENIKQVADIKAACVLLKQDGKCDMLDAMKGGYLIISNNRIDH